jgi:hypothetical protein
VTALRRFDPDDVGVVGAGAAFLLLAFLPWYEAVLAAGTLRFRGWDLGWSAVLALLLAGYAAGRVIVLRNRPQRPDVPVTPAAETFASSVGAVLLMVYRVLDVPTVVDGGAARTTWLAAACGAVLLQAAFAARKLGRTGLRAAPPE